MKYNKYDKLFDAVDEYREARNEELPNYDPSGYAEDRRKERRKKAEEMLDILFREMIDRLR
jgi:hypothetical protein